MLIASTYALGDFPEFSRFLYGFLIVGPLLWGGLYIFNEITDQKEHCQHPIKRHWPFSAGHVDVSLGIRISYLMIGCAILLGLPFGILFTSSLILMCIKQFAYCLPRIRLKEKFLWDVVSGSLGNASLRFAAGWFLFSDNLEMPLLLLFIAECLQLAGFFANRLYANRGTGIEHQLQYTSTTTYMSTRQLEMIITSCGAAAMSGLILLSVNGQYHILPIHFGKLPIQSMALFIIIPSCLPFLGKAIKLADEFSIRESGFYYSFPLFVAFVSSIILSILIKYF